VNDKLVGMLKVKEARSLFQGLCYSFISVF